MRPLKIPKKTFVKTIDERSFLWYNMIMIAKRAIAFDIGDKRIGVAVSDPFNEYAMPCETYVRTRNFAVDVAAIAKIAKDRGVGVIVCGMPVNFDGTESVQTVKTQQFIDALKAATSSWKTNALLPCRRVKRKLWAVSSGRIEKRRLIPLPPRTFWKVI